VRTMASFGEDLKRERELRRISLREVAQATKVNLRYLEALERNDFEHLPGGVFNRGFVRAYSQFIGVDPDSMVDAYLLEEQAQALKGRAKDRDSFLRPPAGVERGRASDPAEAEDGRRRTGRPLWLLILLAAVVLIAAGVASYLMWGRAEEPGRTELSGTEEPTTPEGRLP
jgi:cytoskeletal protein RodZ